MGESNSGVPSRILGVPWELPSPTLEGGKVCIKASKQCIYYHKLSKNTESPQRDELNIPVVSPVDTCTACPCPPYCVWKIGSLIMAIQNDVLEW